jgi:hypothetical protein
MAVYGIETEQLQMIQLSVLLSATPRWRWQINGLRVPRNWRRWKALFDVSSQPPTIRPHLCRSSTPHNPSDKWSPSRRFPTQHANAAARNGRIGCLSDARRNSGGPPVLSSNELFAFDPSFPVSALTAFDLIHLPDPNTLAFKSSSSDRPFHPTGLFL